MTTPYQDGYAKGLEDGLEDMRDGIWNKKRFTVKDGKIDKWKSGYIAGYNEAFWEYQMIIKDE